MSAIEHRASAAGLLSDFDETGSQGSTRLEMATAAQAHALLAVEDRLADLITEMRTANLIQAAATTVAGAPLETGDPEPAYTIDYAATEALIAARLGLVAPGGGAA